MWPIGSMCCLIARASESSLVHMDTTTTHPFSAFWSHDAHPYCMYTRNYPLGYDFMWLFRSQALLYMHGISCTIITVLVLWFSRPFWAFDSFPAWLDRCYGSFPTLLETHTYYLGVQRARRACARTRRLYFEVHTPPRDQTTPSLLLPDMLVVPTYESDEQEVHPSLSPQTAGGTAGAYPHQAKGWNPVGSARARRRLNHPGGPGRLQDGKSITTEAPRVLTNDTAGDSSVVTTTGSSLVVMEHRHDHILVAIEPHGHRGLRLCAHRWAPCPRLASGLHCPCGRRR
jgi:hypothetical protein